MITKPARSAAWCNHGGAAAGSGPAYTSTNTACQAPDQGAHPQADMQCENPDHLITFMLLVTIKPVLIMCWRTELAPSAPLVAGEPAGRGPTWYKALGWEAPHTIFSAARPQSPHPHHHTRHKMVTRSLLGCSALLVASSVHSAAINATSNSTTPSWSTGTVCKYWSHKYFPHPHKCFYYQY